MLVAIIDEPVAISVAAIGNLIAIKANYTTGKGWEYTISNEPFNAVLIDDSLIKDANEKQEVSGNV